MKFNEASQIRDRLWQYFDTLIKDCGNDYVLIWENQNGTRPVPPFMSLSMDSIEKRGTTPSRLGIIKMDGKYYSAHVQEFRRYFTLRSFGEQTEDCITAIQSMLEYSKYIDMLKKQHIVITETNSVSRNYFEYSEDEEVFYDMPFVVSYLRFTNLELADDGIIEKVEIYSTEIYNIDVGIETEHHIEIEVEK